MREQVKLKKKKKKGKKEVKKQGFIPVNSDRFSKRLSFLPPTKSKAKVNQVIIVSVCGIDSWKLIERKGMNKLYF